MPTIQKRTDGSARRITGSSSLANQLTASMLGQ